MLSTGAARKSKAPAAFFPLKGHPMQLPREVYIWLFIIILGIMLDAYTLYRFAEHGDFLIFAVAAFWLTAYAWYRGMLVLEGPEPPYEPPRPYKPTPPTPLPRRGVLLPSKKPPNPLPTHQFPVISPPSNPPCAACSFTGWCRYPPKPWQLPTCQRAKLGAGGLTR